VPFATCAYVGLDGCWRAALTANANESLEAGDSEVIVIGFDKGDGWAIRFAASVEEALGGIFTSLGTSGLIEDCSAGAFAAGDCEEEDGAGFKGAMDPLASRLAA
jgi:hypothetical protein